MTDITFDKVYAETKDAKRKSDLQNLAHAKLNLEQQIAEAQALIKEIDAAAADPNTPLEKIKSLYKRAGHGLI